MKTLPLVVGLTVLLAACQQTQAPVSVGSVAVAGDSTLIIGQSKSLTPTIKDAAGNALTGRDVTWTSSAPELISVDAAGKITARHFSPDASKKTVTITATSEGKTGSINVMPYGFDLSCGTSLVNSEIYTAVYTRFRMPDGSAVQADTKYAVTGPATFNDGKPYEGIVFKSTSAGGVSGGALALAGDYSGSITVDNVTYTDKCTIDPKAVLGLVTQPAMTVTNNTATFSGTAPSQATHVYAALWANTTQYGTVSIPLSTATFTATSALTVTPPKGTYEGWIFARNYSNASPMPESVLMSATRANTGITIP